MPFAITKVQFLRCTFQMHFGVGTRHFEKIVLKMILLLSSQSFICHLANIGVKICFHSCCYENQNFSVISHSFCSCNTCVTVVLFVEHTCWTRVACVSVVSFKLHSCHTPIASVWHSCCKIDQILFNKTLKKHIFFLTTMTPVSMLNLVYLNNTRSLKIFSGNKFIIEKKVL